MRTLALFLTLLPHLMVVSALLWGLSWVGKLFIYPEPNTMKLDNFECGFENTTTGQDQLFYKNQMALFFLLLYEVELLLLLPIAFNSVTVTKTAPIVIMSVLVVIVYTCLLDVETGTIEYEN